MWNSLAVPYVHLSLSLVYLEDLRILNSPWTLRLSLCKQWSGFRLSSVSRMLKRSSFILRNTGTTFALCQKAELPNIRWFDLAGSILVRTEL